MRKERLVNLRFLFCLFFGLMLGVIVSRLFLFKKINVIWLIVFLLISLGIMIIAILYANKTSEYNKSIRARKNISFLLRSSAIGFFISFVVGIVVSIFPLLNIINIHKFEDATYFTGTISDYVDQEETYTKFIVDDVRYSENEKNINLDFKIIVYTSALSNFKLGDKIEFKANLNELEHVTDTDFSKLSQGIGYSIFINSSEITKISSEVSFRDIVHNNVRKILDDNMNKDNADISYAVLFGQKHGLSDDISNMFSYAGISHILAVSGLHVGVLVTMLWFAMNKIKMNKYIKLILFGGFLFLYSYLCLFSPSVCRASIMAIVLATCRVFGWEYDSLSSLSLAGVIILLISPMTLFTISFQLSFVCILAIISFAPTLTRILNKLKMPKFLTQSLSISLAVTIAILPICMNAFTEISILGLLTNIIVLPIFSLTYITLFIVVLLSLLFNVFGNLLVVSNIFLHLIKVIAQYISEIPFGVFKAFNCSYITLFVLALVYLTIHFFMTKNLIKSIWVCVLTFFVCTQLVVGIVPKNYDDRKLLIAEQYKSNVLIYVGNDETIMIGSNISCNNLTYIMKEFRLSKIDKVIAYDLQLNKLNELVEIKNKYNVDNFILPIKYDYFEINSILDDTENYSITYKNDYLYFNDIMWNDQLVGIELKIFENDILVPIIDNNNKENNYLAENYSSFDYYIVDNINDWCYYLDENKLINIYDTKNIVLDM